MKLSHIEIKPYNNTHCLISYYTVKGLQFDTTWALPMPTLEEVKEELESNPVVHTTVGKKRLTF